MFFFIVTVWLCFAEKGGFYKSFEQGHRQRRSVGGGGGATPPHPITFESDIFPKIKIIKIFSSNQCSSSPRKHSLEVFWKKGFLKNSCSEIKKKRLLSDLSRNTTFSLMSTDRDITSSTQECLKQA